MTEPGPSPFTHPGARAWTVPEPIDSARAFHRTLEGYRTTPLTELPAVATELGVGRVFLKDESERLGLPAFKILGASWAVAKAIAAKFGIPPDGVSLEALRNAIGDSPLTLVTATDGNHGRAISHFAKLLGIRARIYTPAGVSEAALEGIRSEGAELIELAADYDDVVRAAAASLEGNESELLIQDTSWPGYERVPRWIVEGYTTLFSEIDEQLARIGLTPDVVVIPTGVGSLLQAAVEYYRGTSGVRSAVFAVEPNAAACVLESLLADQVRTVDTSRSTIMTGLRTGTTSEIAWPSLRAGLDLAVAIDDGEARVAVRDFEGWGFDVGPCGAASLAGIRKVRGDRNLAAVLGLPESPVVVLLSTEGLAANPLPD
ncbi:MAG: diaminopropionate ammonia-lyase [Microbacteriaceae bacterium]|nr:diaminopropionate ammonia-lyase [Microbacteriaceae bacterium]